jgi:uncharacterized protein YqfA (UPF0365 family)
VVIIAQPKVEEEKIRLFAFDVFFAFIPIMRYLSAFVAIGILACWLTVGLPSVVRRSYVAQLNVDFYE